MFKKLSIFISSAGFSFIALLAFVLFLDRLSKMFALNLEEKVEILGSISIDPVFNRGVSFGFFSSDKVFFPLIIIIFAVLLFFVAKVFLRLKSGKSFIPEVLIISGALGNIFDRILYGGIIDFISLSYRGFFFPTFNISDVAICLGVLLIFLRHKN